MPRGGKRPGAGAPRGNRNRLRHGKRSRYVQEELIPTLAPYPALHRWFIGVQRRAARNKKHGPDNPINLIEAVIAISQFPPDHPMRAKLQDLNDSLERSILS